MCGGRGGVWIYFCANAFDECWSMGMLIFFHNLFLLEIFSYFYKLIGSNYILDVIEFRVDVSAGLTAHTWIFPVAKIA